MPISFCVSAMNRAPVISCAVQRVGGAPQTRDLAAGAGTNGKIPALRA
jgi:hypothetical protein